MAAIVPRTTPNQLLAQLQEPFLLTPHIRQHTGLIVEIAKIIAHYTLTEQDVPPFFTLWHRALVLKYPHLDMDTLNIPAPSQDLLEQANKALSLSTGFFGKKVVGTYNSLGILYLAAPDSIEQSNVHFRQAVERLAPDECRYNETPRGVRMYSHCVSKEDVMDAHGKTTGNDWTWVWISRDVLPGSGNCSLSDHTKMVAKIAKKAGQRFQVPELRLFLDVLQLHNLATGEYLYNPEEFDADTKIACVTHVQETVQGTSLYAGPFNDVGLAVNSSRRKAHRIGIAIMLKLS